MPKMNKDILGKKFEALNETFQKYVVMQEKDNALIEANTNLLREKEDLEERYEILEKDYNALRRELRTAEEEKDALKFKLRKAVRRVKALKIKVMDLRDRLENNQNSTV